MNDQCVAALRDPRRDVFRTTPQQADAPSSQSIFKIFGKWKAQIAAPRFDVSKQPSLNNRARPRLTVSTSGNSGTMLLV
jgi:hypothetical protein